MNPISKEKMQSTVKNPVLKMRLRALRYVFATLVTLLSGSLMTDAMDVESINASLVFFKSMGIIGCSVATILVEGAGLWFGVGVKELQNQDE